MEDLKAPIRLILGAMLSYALRDQAQEIRLTPTDKGIEIHYLINGAWRYEFNTPAYILGSLTEHLTEIAQIPDELPLTGIFPLELKDEKHQVEFSVPIQVRFHPTDYGARIHLEFLKRD